MPHQIFLRGATPGEPTAPVWMKTFARRIIIFEQDTLHGDDPVEWQIARWLKQENIPKHSGFIHPMTFPECPHIRTAAWTAFRGFQMLEPSNTPQAPKELLWFISSTSLLAWKRKHWSKLHGLRQVGFAVHANCYAPTGERFKQNRLLTF